MLEAVEDVVADRFLLPEEEELLPLRRERLAAEPADPLGRGARDRFPRLLAEKLPQPVQKLLPDRMYLVGRDHLLLGERVDA